MIITLKNGETKIENSEDKDNVIRIEGDGNVKNGIVQKSGGKNFVSITGNGNTISGITQG